MGEGKTTMGQGAVSWHLVLDAFSLCLYLPLQPFCLDLAVNQFLSPIPLSAPILCPPACRLPAPGRPFPLHGRPGRLQRRY